METTVAECSIKYLQVLNENGVVDESLAPKISTSQLKAIYELMILTRTFDEKAVFLQRQGRLGTFASVRGQEACQIPSAIQMEDDDLAFPAFREHGLFLTRGMSPEQLLQYWGGDERGMAAPKKVNVFPVAITVGGHLPHAVGAAMGFRMQKKKSVTLVYFGDGATSEGDFHEAMNFAGVFKAPTIFLCQNNQYAISTPVKEQSASATLAQKAFAYGFEGRQIDGNDVLAVYKATAEAIKKARDGLGPTFLELMTYRLGDHTTSDDAKRYRKEEELKIMEQKEPLIRFKKYLAAKGILTDAYEKEVQEKATQKVNDAVTKYEAIVPAPGSEIFKYVYATMTDSLQEQLDQFSREVQ